MWPSEDELLAGLQAVVADPTSAGVFAESILGPLTIDLGRRFPRAHPDDITTAADDAVLAVLRNPGAFDPTRGPLAGFLRLIARRDLSNLLDKETRHRRGRIPWAAVELAVPARNDRDEDAPDWSGLESALDGLSAEDRSVFELMRDGERDTTMFAAALGITDLPTDERTAIVKRAKDRVKARLKRAGGGDER